MQQNSSYYIFSVSSMLFLCTPVSVASERLFSSASNICTDLHTHHKGRKVNYDYYLIPSTTKYHTTQCYTIYSLSFTLWSLVGCSSSIVINLVIKRTGCVSFLSTTDWVKFLIQSFHTFGALSSSCMQLVVSVWLELWKMKKKTPSVWI